MALRHRGTVLALMTGCISGFTNVAPKSVSQCQVLGPTEGTGCGSLGIVATAYYFIPLGTVVEVGLSVKNTSGQWAYVRSADKEGWISADAFTP